MPTDWSRDEVELVVADYFAMLRAELAGEPFSKAEVKTTGIPPRHPARGSAAARWLREADDHGELALALNRPSDRHARDAAEIEGWILGVR